MQEIQRKRIRAEKASKLIEESRCAHKRAGTSTHAY